MEQIYYTQCPVGYGMGASNGFQIKRLTPGYPLSGDFRHLGLKAFPAGGRNLAPPVLRYRRDGEFAEVAWLTPRAHEYETERGLWGRPGGVFAHGLRLGPAELASLRNWPAGLFESPLWKRTDREPTRGRPPEDVELSLETLLRPPSFADIAPLGSGEDLDQFARLLTALAAAVREGRTLFLVDEPSRLGPRIALLTFAFPEALRADLTFSTYHERPEELPGFRVQGTSPLARPNKAALTSLGRVADLTTGVFEPPIEPQRWASTLAGWFARREAIDEADWSSTDARCKVARKLAKAESVWNDGWLDHLFGFDQAYRRREAPESPEAWQALEGFATWSGQAGQADEWLRPRGPAWWLAGSRSGSPIPEARRALVAHASLREAWKGDAQPAAWGEAVAAWFREAEATDRDDSLAKLLHASPKNARPSFARALLRGLTQLGATAVLERLRTDSTDRGMLLPLEASATVAAILEGGDRGPLGEILVEARGIPGATSAVLDAVEAGLVDRPELASELARASVEAFDLEGPGGGREGLAWALRRGNLASTWLGPALRPILADPGRLELWQSLSDRTPEPLRAALARAVLEVADDPGLPDEAFRWGVEGLLLTLAPRPIGPSWAETYLRRTPSDLRLIDRLFSKKHARLGLLAWIDQARARGEISSAQATRIDNGKAYVRSLNSGDAQSLLSLDLPGVPVEERGVLLGQLLARVGGLSLEGLPFVLDACRGAWPEAFKPGEPGLKRLAAPLARCLDPLKLAPDVWLGRTVAIVERLGLARGFEPDGLAAEMASVASKGPDLNPWPLRQYLLRHPDAWRILAADVRRELGEVPVETAPEVLLRWDKQLVQEKPERFFELFLNASDGPRLSILVASRGADLKSLPPLPWWDHGRVSGAINELRDAYARLAPIAPISEGRLFVARNWVTGAGAFGLSTQGMDRWRCLEAITNFRQAGSDVSARWPVVTAWEADLPYSKLSNEDKYRFLAWLIIDLDGLESHQVARLAKWLHASGVDDVERIARWSEELEGLTDVDGQTRLGRAPMVGDLKAELMTLIREARGLKRARTTDKDRL